MDCSPPGSSVHGILLDRFWSRLPFPSTGNLPSPGAPIFCTGRQILYHWATGKLCPQVENDTDDMLLCISSISALRDSKLGAWNWPWWEYWHCRNQGLLHIGAFNSSREPVVRHLPAHRWRTESSTLWRKRVMQSSWQTERRKRQQAQVDLWASSWDNEAFFSSRLPLFSEVSCLHEEAEQDRSLAPWVQTSSA